MKALLLLLLAQNPQPARGDSIYALRVDPTAHPGQDYVLLLDEATARLETDGRSSYTLRQVAQVLTADGAESWGELALWYVPQRQRLHINWIRVIGPDGTVVRDGPEHQEETAPTVDQGAPVYSERRAIQATLGGVAPGTLVDYSYTLETVRPQLPGDFRYYWALNGDNPVRRSRFTLDVPAELDVAVRESNLGFSPDDRLVSARRVRIWAAAELPAVKWESYAGSPNEVMKAIVVGGTLSWADVASWYDALLVNHFAVTPEILAAHALQLAGAKTLDDSLRATYRWVAQDFRYVSLSLGDGGYQPRLPAEVFRTRFGDCKDKTLLFVSLVRHMRLKAYPVLVNSGGYVDSTFPGIKQFDHMIAAVERGGGDRGRIEYADVTPTFLGYGKLPSALQGEVGMALPDGRARVVVFPASPPDRNRYDREIVGSLGLDRRFTGRITVTALGTEEPSFRERFADIDRQDAQTRNELLRKYARAVYESAVVDSARYFDGRDLGATPRVTVWLTAAHVIGRVGARYYFNPPLLKFGDASAIGRLEGEGERRFPIDVAQVNSPTVWKSSVEVELPEGWKADVPADVTVDGAFGYYHASYKQVGRAFRASREMGGRRGLEPPDSAAALRAWLRAVAADATEMIVLQRGSGRALLDVADADTDAVPGKIGELAAVLLSPQDFPSGVRVTTEGTADNDGFMSLASRDPIETYQRTFTAEQMVFKLGSSRFAMVQVSAGAYHTAAEAQRSVGLLSLVDLPAFFEVYLGEMGLEQASLKAGHPIDLSGIGDHAAGWTFSLVTPFATFDLALMVATRDRVTFMLVAVGPQPVSGEDLAKLLRTMDGRLHEHAGYATDVAFGPEDNHGTTAADSALRAATPTALDEIVARPAELAGTTTDKASFALNNGWPQYTRTVEGRGLTFPLHGAGAITLQMDAMLHATEAQALKRVLFAESGDRKYLFGSMLSDDVGKMVEHIAADDSSLLQPQPAPNVGTRSFAVLGKLQTMIHMDVDAVFVSSGRLSVQVIVTQLPGTGKPGAAAAVARGIQERMRRVLPRGGGAPSERLIREVRRVIQAERAVDSLVDARDFPAVFATIERAGLARAPVGFWTRTWNRVCWWASLSGLAQRAQAACDAAVAPDTTLLTTRDSRGLARALAGDLKGAAVDFAYVVDHAKAGSFLDKRAAWLEALRAGRNPFTDQVLGELRKQ
jgi:hypothetical protein